MTKYFQETGSELAWGAARSRLEEYLRALRIIDQDQRDRIIPRALERVACKQADHPGESPTALAMAELQAEQERWFEQNLLSRERIAVSGLMAWFALDAPEKWAAAFLAEDPPAEFQRGLQECQVAAAPPLRVSSMVPQPFLNPLRNATNLPGPLGRLAQELAPLATKAATAALSALSLLSGVRVW